MPRICPGMSGTSCVFNARRAAAPVNLHAHAACLFCDLERLETLVASSSGRQQVIRMLRVPWAG